MIFKNSKLLLTVLTPITAVLMAVLVINVYNIRAKNNETSRLLSVVREADDARVHAQVIRTIRYEAMEDIEAFEEIVLSEDRFISLIETIEDAGQALSLEANVVSVTKVDEKKSKGPNTIRVVVEAQGSWARIFAFLQALESLPYRITMEESNLNKEADDWHSRSVITLNSFD